MRWIWGLVKTDIIERKNVMEEFREYYIMEVKGEGCYCLCYDDVNGRRVIYDPEIEVRWDYEGSESFVEEE